MPMRRVAAVLAMALAGCGGGGTAEGNGSAPADDPAPAEDASRFEVSADTQRLTTPDSMVAPSENPNN